VKEINRQEPKNRWGLALLAGVVAEAGVFAVMPVALTFGEQAPLYVIPPASFCITCLFGFLVARKVASHRMLHGAIVGAVAALIYIVITVGLPLPITYVVSHFLKVFGGMTGGYLAERPIKQPASMA
jgi:hypothetical protein